MKKAIGYEGVRKYAGRPFCLAGFVLIIISAGIVILYGIVSAPDVVLLAPEKGAEWIRLNRPVWLGVYKEPTGAHYKKKFHIENPIQHAVLTIRALKIPIVIIDKQLIYVAPEGGGQNWKKPIRIDLSMYLHKGDHELTITVYNDNGPPMLLAYCEEMDLFTDESWEASLDAKKWSSAVLAEEVPEVPLSREFPRVDQAFRSQLPLFITVFFIIFLWTFLWHSLSEKPSWFTLITPPASTIRWIMLFAWIILALNNISKVPVNVGFDIHGHIAYIKFIAEQKSIPLAGDGWEMFQSPLFYLISAPFYLLTSKYFHADAVVWMLRIVPLLCGIMLVEVSFRTLRYVFPGREDLQAIGVLVSGFLPATFYICQGVINESLSGLLSSIVVLYCFSLIRVEADEEIEKNMRGMGIFLGLALLTKATSVLLIPPIIALIVWKFVSGGRRSRAVLSGAFSVLGLAFLISGWYYMRNWIELGKPFISGWEPLRQQSVWFFWQEPGYRTFAQFLRFGESLLYPVYCAMNGFWDSVYSTLWLDGFVSGLINIEYLPWNFSLMLSGAWLAILPSAGIILGIILSCIRPSKALKQGLFFAAMLIIVYYTALLYLFLKYPFHSTAKASYTVGIVPCYGILCAAGLDFFIRKHVIYRALVYSGIGCWAITAYFAYFVF